MKEKIDEENTSASIKREPVDYIHAIMQDMYAKGEEHKKQRTTKIPTSEVFFRVPNVLSRLSYRAIKERNKGKGKNDGI